MHAKNFELLSSNCFTSCENAKQNYKKISQLEILLTLLEHPIKINRFQASLPILTCKLHANAASIAACQWTIKYTVCIIVNTSYFHIVVRCPIIKRTHGWGFIYETDGFSFLVASIISGCATPEITTWEKVNNNTDIINLTLYIGALALVLDNVK